jgi:CRISPR system Cascade subunit CasC
MPDSRFLQIHTLTSFSGVLLNRDETGAAKRMPYGGAVRTRISSQCLKRHWRTAAGEWSLEEEADKSLRTRHIFEKELLLDTASVMVPPLPTM